MALSGPGSIIAANRAIMQGVQARARALKAQGRPADEAAKTVQAEFQAKHPDLATGQRPRRRGTRRVRGSAMKSRGSSRPGQRASIFIVRKAGCDAPFNTAPSALHAAQVLERLMLTDISPAAMIGAPGG